MAQFLTMEGFAKLVRPFKVRLSNLISRGVVKRTNDDPGVQEVQAELLTEEVRDELEHMQFFGFTSNPDDGAECLAAFPGGDRSMGFVIATADRRYRVKVEKGEVALYDKTGSKVLLKKDGSIEVTPSSGTFKVNGTIEATGDMRAGGTIEATIDMRAGGNIQADGTIEAAGDIRGGGTIEAVGDVVAGVISLQHHTHAAGTALIAPSGGGPVTGTTAAAG